MSIKLDAKDKKILYQLDINSRQSNAEIGKKVGLSKEVVNYRIKRLEKEGLIEGYFALINTSKLGLMYCRLFFKFYGMSYEKEKEWTDFIRKMPNLSYMGTIHGLWDFAIVILAKDMNELNESYQRILDEFSEFIIDKEVSVANCIHHFYNNFLTGLNDNNDLLIQGGPEPVDAKDRQIINLLMKNSKAGILEISKEIKQTPKIASLRLKKLIKKGFILGFRYKLNHLKIDYNNYHIFWYFKKINRKKRNSLIMFFRENPNVTYVTEAIGSMDLECDFMVKSENELYEKLKEIKVRFADIIKDYKLFLIYKVHKIF